MLVDQVHLGIAPSYSQLIFAISISMLAYTGIETVSNMAEEARDPGEQVPKAVNLVLVAVLGLYAGISIVALSALPVTQDAAGHYATALGTTYADDPVLGIVSALHLHGALATAARYYVGALAATILLIATNAGMIGISRLSWSLAEHRQLPGVFARLHPRYRHALVHDPLLRRDRDRAGPAGQHRLPRQPLQLRRDALLHDRPPLDRRPALPPARPRTGPTGRPGTCAGAAPRSR